MRHVAPVCAPALALTLFVALSAAAAPLAGEHLLLPGQAAPTPADARVVPGYAGAWRQAAAQESVRARILELEARRPCADAQIVDTRQAAPDLLETQPSHVHHALEHWIVSACGRERQYDVWYRFEKSASQVGVVESGCGDFQGELDPPYHRLVELAAARTHEDAGGHTRRLNLPLPGGWAYAAQSGKAGQGWRTDFMPQGARISEWTDLISVQAIPRKGIGQARSLLEGMADARQARCGAPPGPIDEAADALAGDSLQTLLLCPRVPDTNYAELALVKAIEAPDFVYLVQRQWRLPAADAGTLREASADQVRTASYFLSLVRLCGASTRDCPAPFPR